MKELLTEDLLNSLRLMKYDRSRTLMENNLLVEQGPWDSKSGDNKYWVALYNRLKNNGIGVKYGTPDGKETTDYNKSTFLYWGPWIIWKDQNKNGGYPIQLYSTSGSYTFKWKSGKYRGEELNKSIILCGQKKGIDFILTDLLPINDVTKAKKLIGYGGCKGMNETLLVGGVDTYKTAQLTKEFPYCFKKPSQDISKSDPLYNQKIDPKILTGEPKKPYMDYGSDIEPLINRSKASHSELVDVVKKGGVTNLYDLVWSNDVKKDEIEKLKYPGGDSTQRLGGVTFKTPTEKAFSSGYPKFKEALKQVNINKTYAGWDKIPDYKNGYVVANDNGNMLDMLGLMPLAIAIDPSELEVTWAELVGETLSSEKNIKDLIDQTTKSFDNFEKLKVKGQVAPYAKGMGPNNNPLTKYNWKDNVLFITQLKQKEKEHNGYSGPTINSPGSSNTNPWTTLIKDYEDRLAKEVNKAKNTYVKLDTSEDYRNIKSRIQKIREALEYINDHNSLLSNQRRDWLDSACKRQVTAPTDQVATKSEMQKLHSYCSPRLSASFTMYDVCRNDKMGGVFVMPSEMKERKDFDISTFKFEKVMKPDTVTCVCSRRKTYENQKATLKNVSMVSLCRPPGQPSEMGYVQGVPYYMPTGTVRNVELNPREFMFTTSDQRQIQQKIGDWGTSCFTGVVEGKDERDFHCLLDVLSVVTVFIPVVGPVISMSIDVLNTAYYLYDAYEAEPGMDRNLALVSAGFTLLGGLSTGYGRARSLLSKTPRATRVTVFADRYIKGLKDLGKNITEKQHAALLKDLQSMYKLTSNELKIVNTYVTSIKSLSEPGLTKVIQNYRNTVKGIKGKILNEGWDSLMKNKNFAKIMIENSGDVVKSIKAFNKSRLGREFLTQLGFFAGGETILQDLISPPIMAKIKKGDWGTFSQQLMLNNYDLQEVYDNFGVNFEDEIQREEDLKLLEKAWRDSNAIIVSGTKKPWRPGELVPEKYRTPIYKKRVKENNYEQYLKEYDPHQYLSYEGDIKQNELEKELAKEFGYDNENKKIKKDSPLPQEKEEKTIENNGPGTRTNYLDDVEF